MCKIRWWEDTIHKLTRSKFEWDAYVIELKLTAMAWEKSHPVSRIYAFSDSLDPKPTLMWV